MFFGKPGICHRGDHCGNTPIAVLGARGEDSRYVCCAIPNSGGDALRAARCAVPEPMVSNASDGSEVESDGGASGAGSGDVSGDDGGLSGADGGVNGATGVSGADGSVRDGVSGADDGVNGGVGIWVGRHLTSNEHLIVPLSGYNPHSGEYNLGKIVSVRTVRVFEDH